MNLLPYCKRCPCLGACLPVGQLEFLLPVWRCDDCGRMFHVDAEEKASMWGYLWGPVIRPECAIRHEEVAEHTVGRGRCVDCEGLRPVKEEYEEET